MKRLILILAIACLPSCSIPASQAGRSTANLTAPGIQALHKQEVVKLLDVIRDTAIDGEALKVVPTATTRIVVSWHKSALEILKMDNWKDALLAGLEQLKKDLPKTDATKFTPYIDAASNTIKAVF